MSGLKAASYCVFVADCACLELDYKSSAQILATSLQICTARILPALILRVRGNETEAFTHTSNVHFDSNRLQKKEAILN